MLPIEQQLKDRPPLTKFRRRLSSGVTYGASELATQASKRLGGKAEAVTGPVTPTPQTTVERKKSRRASSKSDCIIM